jgi:D-Tyr-tRNAtyr deacylase
MKALVQRVVSGRVSVEGECVSAIGRGIVALIGIHRWEWEK